MSCFFELLAMLVAEEPLERQSFGPLERSMT